MITFLAMLMLVLLGGFISYFGDLQGRRWGKKRVSKFGLRPKHTAILLTSLTGAFIALFSIITLMLISPTVRDVVWTGERAIRENKVLIAQQGSKKRTNAAQIAQLTAQNQQIEAENKQITTKNSQLSLRLQQLQTQRQKLVDARNRLQNEQNLLIQAKAEMESTLGHERVVVINLQKIEKQLQKKIQIAERDNTNAASINKDLGMQNVAYQRENASLEKNKQELQQEKARIVADNTTLKNIGAQLRVANEQLLSMNTALKNDGDAQNRKNDELQQKNNELNASLNNVYGLFAGSERDYAQNYLALRRGRLNVRAGEMLGRRVIEGHLRPERVRSELQALLDESSTTALLRGAGRGDNGRAVRIVNKKIVTLAGTEDAFEADSLNSLVENIAGNDRPVVVVANAVNNSLEGEQVWIELSPSVVNTVFKQGEIIASRRIDARQSFDHLLNAIADFLQDDVHKAAIQAGLVPQIDPETGTPRLGHLAPADLIPLTARIRRMGGVVLLTAVAKDTITSADPLSIEFRPKRIGSGL